MSAIPSTVSNPGTSTSSKTTPRALSAATVASMSPTSKPICVNVPGEPPCEAKSANSPLAQRYSSPPGRSSTGSSPSFSAYQRRARSRSWAGRRAAIRASCSPVTAGPPLDEELGPQPEDQRDDRHRDEDPEQDAAGRVDRAAGRQRRAQVGLQQHVAGDRDARGGDQDVPRAGGEEVRDVEARGAAQRGGHALLEQQALQELGLGLVVRAGDLDQPALRELRLDLPRPLARAVGGRLLADPGVDERHPALRAEPLGRRLRRRAARADEPGLRAL